MLVGVVLLGPSVPFAFAGHGTGGWAAARDEGWGMRAEAARRGLVGWPGPGGTVGPGAHGLGGARPVEGVAGKGDEPALPASLVPS